MSATGFHPEPSANAPWTRTIVLTAAYAGDDAAKAAPARRARIKRFMVKPDISNSRTRRTRRIALCLRPGVALLLLLKPPHCSSSCRPRRDGRDAKNLAADRRESRTFYAAP